MIVDNFAGGGGASTGIELALGRPVDIAINHDKTAVAIHSANHPKTEHLCQNIWQVDPADIRRRGEIELAWFSPDCTHHSKAKGGKPRARHLRDLAWTVVLWAQRARPLIILLENVEEFRQWGPLDSHGNPIVERRGEDFDRWIRALRKAGYKVDWRELRACDYGVPTTRKRLFLMARRDGQPIVWPKPTHGAPNSPAVQDGTLKPWKSAAEIIDWTLPCPSIFLTRDEVRRLGLRIKRPLADATMRRIARGVMRYVVEADKPFIVPSDPVGGLQIPTIIQTGYGEREGQMPRVPGAEKPLGTVVSCGQRHALVSTFLAKFRGSSSGVAADQPVPTVTSGAGAARPAGAAHAMGLVTAFLAQANTGVVGHSAVEPLSTILETGSHQQLVAAALIRHFGTSTGSPVELPAPTVMPQGGGKTGVVAAFLQKYYSGGGQDSAADDPLHTITAKARSSLVTVMIEGEPWAITDIGLRMLTPRELFRAQGFPDSYEISPVVDGRPLPQHAQIAACGNSVCPPLAAALVRAAMGIEMEKAA